jgi:hypothetical protein
MKKFLKYWVGIVLGCLIVPSVFSAIAAVAFMSDGGFTPASMLWLAGLGSFATTMMIVGMVGIYPAVAVLVLGIVVCLIRDNSKNVR